MVGRGRLGLIDHRAGEPEGAAVGALRAAQTPRGRERPSMRAMELIARAGNVRPDYFAEYRLAVAMRDLDPSEVGFERALETLDARQPTLAARYDQRRSHATSGHRVAARDPSQPGDPSMVTAARRAGTDREDSTPGCSTRPRSRSDADPALSESVGEKSKDFPFTSGQFIKPAPWSRRRREGVAAALKVCCGVGARSPASASGDASLWFIT